MNDTALTRPQKILIVLGMHRSGTSCLTGSLQQAGLELGEYSDWNPHNLKGNRENSEIMQLNEQVLNANGGSWDIPPRQEVSWPPALQANARFILEKYAHHPFWGFKDPRTIFTLDGWLDLGLKPFYIGIFRHPLAVAGSLMKRSGDALTQKQALDMWHAYNERMLERYEQSPFPLLCFDWPEAIFHAALDKILIDIGLTPPPVDSRFYTQELVHQFGSRTLLPWKVRRLYSRLRKISEHYR